MRFTDSFMSAVDPSPNLAMSLPLGDWQFWVVTLVALIALLWILRGIIPWRRLVGKPAKSRGRKTTLTVGGKPVNKSDSRRGPGGCC